MILNNEIGLKKIREFGLSNFPECACEYHYINGGIIAVRDSKIGKEIHIAFPERLRHLARKSVISLCDSFSSDIWALIEDGYKGTINMAIKTGFEYITKAKGMRLDGSITDVHVMRRLKR